MKKVVSAALVFVSMCLPTSQSVALNGLSCGDLTDAIDGLSLVLDELESRGRVLEDSSYDEELLIVAEAAVIYANAEGNDSVGAYADGMMRGWETKDIDRYIANGDEMINWYVYLRDRDC